jgi:hypothetical protein
MAGQALQLRQTLPARLVRLLMERRARAAKSLFKTVAGYGRVRG